MTKPLILSYAGCGTCKKALAWLKAAGVDVEVRAIVEEPPTERELRTWLKRSGLSVRKWLNTSGQSYRALGKAKVDAASDETIAGWLAADGKLVKRPVLIDQDTVLVGFKEEQYRAHFG